MSCAFKDGMGREAKLILVFTIVLWSMISRAGVLLESTATLPKGIYSPNLIFGSYSGLSEKYNSGGQIQGVADQYRINLSGKFLATLDPKFKELVRALNNLSPEEHLGDRATGGTLTFKASPKIEYFVPTLSYGITSNLSIGFGIPIVHFQNSMQAYAQGNFEAVSRYAHGLSPDIDKATQKLAEKAANLQGSVSGILNTKGYKSLQNEDWTAPGDLQISAVYRYYTSYRWRLAIRPYIQIPTGRTDDPDDLADIATGGQPAIGIYSIHELQILPRWALVSAVGYQYNIEDSATMRVPASSDDHLPDLDRKETVSRQTGNTVFLEGGFSYKPYRPLEFRIVYDYTTKDPDWYQGNHPDWNYGLLSTDTGSQTNQIKGLVEFSTVNYYMQKSFSIPFLLGYIYGNTFYAVNAPNEITNQLYMRMFF